MLKIASLFSGIGTPEQSLEHLNIEHETVFACEIDKYARKTYLANNQEPNTFYEDIYSLDGNKYKNQIDILVGGSPCQSFSIAGKRKGINDARGNLIYEYFRIVEETQPKVFIYENVKGFLSIDKKNKKDKYGETFKNFLQSFKDLGYTTYHQVLNTKDYGIPQNRERIYIVGFKDDVDFHFQEKQELKLRLKDMLEDMVDEKYLLKQELVEKYHETGTASNYKGSQADKVACSEKDKTFWTVNAGSHGYSMGYVKIDSKYHLSEDRLKKCLKSNHSAQRIYCPSGIAPTISAGSNGGGKEPVKMLYRTHTLNIKGNDSIKRIYSSEGLCPSLTTMQGGHREPKVSIENGLIEVENDEVKVKEAVAKVYPLATEGDSINLSVPSSKTRRGRVGKEVAQTLDTACNQAVFKKMIKINQWYLKEDKQQQVGDVVQTGQTNMRGQRIYKTGICPTLPAENPRVVSLDSNYIFRKLTPRECFRLQGFCKYKKVHTYEKDFFKIIDSFIFPEKMSDTQLYKQAGNGMSRNILDMIFTQILVCHTKHIEKAS